MNVARTACGTFGSVLLHSKDHALCSEKLSTTSVRGSSINTLHNPSDRIGFARPAAQISVSRS